MAAAELATKFRQWRGIVDKMHATTRFTPNERLSWTPLRKPLAESVVALVSTAGVQRKCDEPYDLMNEHGDRSFREIPGEVAASDLRALHTHYDTTDANADPNVVFPIDRLRELAAEGTIGAVGPLHIGMMGWNPDGARVRDETAPAVAARLRGAGVDVVILTPG
jgi:D-proline reductase (dithiol) PrdB